jgi:hypothetical protein
MDISKRVINRLEKLVANGPEQVEAVILDTAEQQGYLVGVPAEAHEPSVALSLHDYDRYSVALRNLEVCYDHRQADRGPEDETYLRLCADRLVQRLNYLEEPLELIELDVDEGVAQLRSTVPPQNGDEVTYWEAIVRVEKSSKVSLTRYHWQPNYRDRQVVVYPTAFALVGRIVSDLASSLLEEAE